MVARFDDGAGDVSWSALRSSALKSAECLQLIVGVVSELGRLPRT